MFELTQAIFDATSLVIDEEFTTEMPTDLPTEDPGSGAFITEEPPVRAEPFIGKVEVQQQQFDVSAQEEDITTEFDDQTILIALENENACNPVLRASANAILER